MIEFLIFFVSVSQALQYRDDPFSAYGSIIQRCFMCLRTDPLHKVLERLSQPGYLFFLNRFNIFFATFSIIYSVPSNIQHICKDTCTSPALVPIYA